VGFVLAVGGFAVAELIAPPVNFPWWLGIICGVGVTAGIGYIQGSLITRLHVPSFVVTLAGLLFFEGIVIELAQIDKHAVGGVISLDNSSPVYKLVNNNISVAASWIILVVVIAIYAAVSIRRAARRRAQGLAAPPLSVTLFPYVVPFVGIVLLVYSIFLGRTRLGRYMYAIGGNPEAARRAGIAAGQFIATAIVLLVAAAIDALVRRRGSTGV